MIGASVVQFEDGREVANLRLVCAGSNPNAERGRRDRRHEPTQVALFLRYDDGGERRPDGLDHWELYDGHENVEENVLLPDGSSRERTRLNRRGAMLYSNDRAVRIDLRDASTWRETAPQMILRCPYPECNVTVPRDREYLSAKFSQFVAAVPVGDDGAHDLDIRWLMG